MDFFVDKKIYLHTPNILGTKKDDGIFLRIIFFMSPHLYRMYKHLQS